MDLNIDFGSFIIVLPCLAALCVGWIVKHLLPSERVNRFIPLIAAAVGILMNVWLNMKISPQIAVAGLVSGLASTGMYELFSQFLKNKD